MEEAWYVLFLFHFCKILNSPSYFLLSHPFSASKGHHPFSAYVIPDAAAPARTCSPSSEGRQVPATVRCAVIDSCIFLSRGDFTCSTLSNCSALLILFRVYKPLLLSSFSGRQAATVCWNFKLYLYAP